MLAYAGWNPSMGSTRPSSRPSYTSSSGTPNTTRWVSSGERKHLHVRIRSGGFAILSLMTRSAIEKVERLMAANRYSNYPTPFASANDTALLNDAFNETTSPLWGVSEAILELDLDVGSASTWNSTESAFNGIEEWAEDGTSTRIRPIHIATTIMFMSGIFQVCR